jgi:hypothetical protein
MRKERLGAPADIQSALHHRKVNKRYTAMRGDAILWRRSTVATSRTPS